MGNKHPTIREEEKLKREDIDRLKEITKFSEAEIQQWHKGFFQDCPDGKLDGSTLTRFYVSYYGEHGTKFFCKYMFASFDKNSDGAINFEEFLTAVSPRCQGKLSHRLGFLFDMYDTNGDEKINSKELVALITAMYDLVDCTDRKGEHHPEERAKNIISKLDRNKDNQLDREEFIVECSKDSVIRRLLAPHFEESKNNSIK
ncbi:unnamed protein product [Rotaria socialis]|uniref:EF-hand domain-containing protein n=1 Tax=Rotaria socialis TaxID=392032 RepID=A0A818XYG6_9BILA|nr:unnamed protein product [Rotaria socialis]CAF3372968.1 unnamed protein product [Rotaria socialis]CAF3430367.1 unnamed protein product [Rotaria socialis]CAF3467993.1 unnamed protein product [Rotaria socialis]CAF3747062.1 unnamed protein product [Rotaria socialis]